MRRALVVWALVAGAVAGWIVGTAPGEGGTAEAAVGPLERVTVPATAFHEQYQGQDRYNTGVALRGTGDFMATLSFPYEEVRIRRIVVRYYDDNSNKLCVSYYRSEPDRGYATSMGIVCSEGASSANPRAMSFTPLNGTVKGWRAGYLWVHIEGTATNLVLYGVTVEYRQIL